MKTPRIVTLTPTDADWPVVLNGRLGETAPAELHAIGEISLLRSPLTALFCSASTPGTVILRAHDEARRMRDAGLAVISGFHSVIEKECFSILLRGKQPLIFCPARSLRGMRLTESWIKAVTEGRLLIISPFAKARRLTEALAEQRNELVAALADNVLIACLTSGGKTELLAEKIAKWNIPQKIIWREGS